MENKVDKVLDVDKELSINGEMASITEHYENHLANCYSWLFGGLEVNVKMNKDFFLLHSLFASKYFYSSRPWCRIRFSINTIVANWI